MSIKHDQNPRFKLWTKLANLTRETYIRLCVASFCMTTSYQSTTPILSVYAKEAMGATIPEIGLIVSAFYISASVSRPTLSLATHGKTARLVFALGSILIAVSPLAYILAHNSPEMIAYRIIHGLAFAAYGPYALALAEFVVPKSQRGHAIMTYTSSLALGMTLGPAVGTFSITMLGTKGTFYFASLIGAIGAIMSYKIWGIEVTALESRNPHRAMTTLRSILSNKLFLISFAGSLALSFLYGVILTYVPIHVKSAFGYEDADVTAIFFGYSIALTLSRLFTERITRRFRKRLALCAALLSASFACFLLSLSASKAEFALLFILLGLSHGVVYPIGVLIISEAVESSEIVFANSLYFDAFDIGAMLGPLVMVPVAESQGLPQTLALSSLSPLTGALLVFIVSNVGKRKDSRGLI